MPQPAHLLSLPSNHGLGASSSASQYRWARGRDWDGVGHYCDAATTEETVNKFLGWGSDEGMTLSSFIQRAADVYPHKRALTYLDGKGKETDIQTFAEVAVYARRIASYLQREAGLCVGDRAVLLYPPGPEFILAFVGCLFAGVVPVPVYPPHPYRLEVDVPRLSLIVERSGCRVALTDQSYSLVIRGIQIKSLLAKVGLAGKVDWPSLRTVCTDKVRRGYQHEDLVQPLDVSSDDVAFLQYTSGSTSLPKGVMVTHRNLVAQVHLVHKMSIQAGGPEVADLPVVSWLPQYHDMGLIGTFLTCLTSTNHLVYLTPITFLQDPTQWLLAMSRYRAACSPAPNFAFALVTRKTPPHVRDTLDLSGVRALICGAEPIRPEVMSAFFSYFGRTGLKPTTLMPAYGLAEFTLCATAQVAGVPFPVLHVDGRVLRRDGVVKALPLPLPQQPADAEGGVTYVSVGSGQGDTVIRIVDPHTRIAQGEGRVGEIWLAGSCKAVGYFADEAQSSEAFHASIQGEETGTRYLRSGDEGFLWQGLLYLTGRIKDLIILRGRNIYPQDVEYLVEQRLGDVLKPGCSAAFAFATQGEEGVGYVAEVRDGKAPAEGYDPIIRRIRQVVAEAFELSLCAVVLVKPRSIPKTTSGKIQRHKCHEGYLDGTLSEVFAWQETSLQGGASEAHMQETESDGCETSSKASEASDDGSFVSTCSDQETLGEQHPDEGEEQEAGGACTDMHVEESAPSEEEGDFVSRLVAYVAEHRQLSASCVDIDEPLSLLGFDSVACVALAHVASQWVGKPVSPLVAYRHQTIRALASYLAQGAPAQDLFSLDSVGDEDLQPDLQAPVALIGIGCRVPSGGDTGGDVMGPRELWQFFMKGGHAVAEDAPGERQLRHRTGQLPGAYLQGVDGVDAPFFGMRDDEARELDYRQAMVLESTWHALEDAGIVPGSLRGRCVGVYVGAIGNDFATLHATAQHRCPSREPCPAGLHSITGGATSILAARVSHFLGLKGPSLTMDSACSSSLVALHTAVQDLRLGVCSLAIVAGVNLMLLPTLSEALSDAGLSSTTCRSFDATADGYARGEAVGVVVLRRWGEALAGGDRVYALVRGGAVRHEGGGQGGVGVPSVQGQEDLLRAAYKDAGVDPSQVVYVEAMGSGSPVGDGVELLALSHVLAPPDVTPQDKGPGRQVLVGSGKANMGHSEAAAGVMSVIRGALIVHHCLVPRALHFQALTQLLGPAPSTRLHVPVVDTPLIGRQQQEGEEERLVVGVSALGLGGTNAHVVLEAAPDMEDHWDTSDGLPDPSVSPLLLLPLSAASPASLQALGLAYLRLLMRAPPGSSGEGCSYEYAEALCVAASTRRAHLWPHRLAVTGTSPSELAGSLRAALLLHEQSPPRGLRAHPGVAFLLPSCLPHDDLSDLQGLASGLYRRHPLFKASIDECDAAFADAGSPPPLLADSLLKWAPTVPRPCPCPEALGFATAYGLARVWLLLLEDKTAVQFIGQGHVAKLVGEVVRGAVPLRQAVQLLRQAAGEGAATALERPTGKPREPSGGVASVAEGLSMHDPRPSVVLVVLTPHGPAEGVQEHASRLLPSHRIVGCVPWAGASPMGPTDSTTDDALVCVARCVAAAYGLGVGLDLATLHAGRHSLPPSVLDLLPYYPFEHKTFAPLPDLLHRAFAPQHSASHAGASGVEDFGVTSLFEETWLPRLCPPAKRALLPPERVVWVCARAKDACELLCCVALSSSSVVVVGPDQESELRTLLSATQRPQAQQARLVVADVTRGEACVPLMESLRCGGRGAAVVFVAGEGTQGLEGPEALASEAFDKAVLLVGLLRGCLEAGPATRVWAVTCGAKPVSEGEKVAGLNGSLWALVRSAVQELYPSRLWAALVDLERGTTADTLVTLLCAEMRRGQRSQVPEQLAWRDGRWLLLRLQPSPLDPHLAQPNLSPTPTLRPAKGREEGWVLVSGGLGGLALHATNALVRHGVRRLVLMGRSGAVSQQYAYMVDKLREQLGVEVRVAKCDVSDYEAVSRLVTELSPDGVRGILHCAGALGDGSLSIQNADKLRGVWDGKVLGALNLHTATLSQPRPLDFFLIYGSSSALLGCPSEATYACANAAADFVAILRRQMGLCGTSLQWGAWTGVGFASQAFNQAVSLSGFPPITAAHGNKCLTLLLNHVASLPPVLGCMPVDWRTFAVTGPVYLTQGSMSNCDALLELASRSTPVQTVTETALRYQGLEDEGARLGMMEALLSDTICDVTGRRLEAEDDVLRAGVTSLQGIQILGHLTEALGIKFKPTKLMEHRTVARLASFLCSELDALVPCHGPQRLPLTAPQRLLLSCDDNASRRLLYHESTLHGGLSAAHLISAYTDLLARHPFLRTTLDLPSHSQHVHPPNTLPLSPLYHQLRDPGAVRDTTTLQEVLSEASQGMSTLAPVRLLSGPRRQANAHVVVLAVSPLLADRYTLRCVSAELLALYAARLHPSTSASPALGPRSPCFLDPSQPPALPIDDKPRPSRALAHPKGGLRIAELHQESAIEAWAPVRLRLSAPLARGLSSAALRAGVSPAAVLLAAYAASLAELSETQGQLTVAADVERCRGILGPLSGPRLVPLLLPKLGQHSLHELRAIDTLLRTPQPQPHLCPTARAELLGFTFVEDRGVSTGGDGAVAVASSLVDTLPKAVGPTFAGPLCLTVLAQTDPAVAQWVLTLETGRGYSMAQADLHGLMQRLLKHLGESSGGLSMGMQEEEEVKDEKGGRTRSLPVPPSHQLPKSVSLGAPALPYLVVGALQLVGLGLVGMAACVPLLLLYPLLERCLAHLHLPSTLALLPFFVHVYGVLLCLQVALVRCILPLPPPGSYPLHSFPALRWWLQCRLLRLVDRCYMGHLQGTPLHHWWLRALGCKLGQDVRGLQGGAIIADPDLVTIGDCAALGPSVRLVGSVVRDGMLHRGTISVGGGGVLGAGVVMLPNSRTQAHVTLQVGSVVQEGQSLGGGSGVYTGHPAAFLRPHTTEPTLSEPRQGAVFAVGEALLRCLLPQGLAVLAAALAYEPMTRLLDTLHVFPFLALCKWPQGRLLFCLLALLGPLPLLCLPLLLGAMTLRFRVLSCDDRMLATVAGQIGAGAVSATQIRQQLYTEQGLQALRSLLPSNMQLLGAAGSEGLRLVMPGRLAVERLVLPFVMLPEARVYGVVGNLWVLAVGLALAQLLTAALMTLLTRLLRFTEGLGRGQAHLGRSLRVALVQWAWATSMQPFAGTELVCWWYRCLGARVGDGVVLGNVSPPHDPHLLTVGQGALLMDGAIIDTSGKQPEGPFDHEAPRGVVVGPGAVLGPKAVVESGGKLGGGCMVLPLSTVLAGTRVPEGAVVEGSCVIGHHNDEPAHMSNPVKPPAKGGVLGWVAVLAKACFLGLGLPLLTHVVGLLVVCVSLYPPCLALAWALTSVRSNGLGLSATQGTACLGLVHVLFLLTLALLVAGHKWLIVGRLRAGRAFPLHGATYHRRRSGLVMQGLGGSSGLEDLAGSVLCPLYLRLLGANIDRHAGVYSMEVGDPDVLRVGEGAVLDDGAVLCPAAIDKGEPGQTCGLRLGPIWVRAGGRVGCGAVVMAGTEVGEGATVGDASLLPPNTVVEAGRTRCGVALAQDEDEEERAGPGSHCVSSLTIEVSA